MQSLQNIRYIVGLCSCLLMFPVVSWANSMAELVDLAIANDHRLLQAQSILESQQASVGSSRALRYPQVVISANANQTHQTQTTDLEYANIAGEIGVEQALWQRAIRERENIGELNVIGQRIAFERAKQNLLDELSKAFFALFEAKTGIELAEVQIDTYSKSLEREKQRLESGVSTLTQVAAIEAELALADSRLIFAKSAEQVAYDTLERIIGSTVVIPDITESPKLAMPQETLGMLEKRVLRYNFDLQLARLALRQANSQLRLAKNVYDPSIALFGKFVHATNPQGMDVENTYYQYGVSFRMPLYTGGKATADTKAAEYQAIAAQQGIDHLHAILPVQLRAQWKTMQAQLKGIDARKKSVDAAEKALELVSTSYNAGIANQQQFLDGQSRLFAVQSELDNARYIFGRQYIDFYVLVGVLNEENVLSLASIWLAQE